MSEDMNIFKNAYNKTTSYLDFINEIMEDIRSETFNPKTVKEAFTKFCIFVNAEKGLLIMFKPYQKNHQIFTESDKKFSTSFNMTFVIPSRGLPFEKTICFGPQAIIKAVTVDTIKQKQMDDFILNIDKDIKSYVWLPIVLCQEMVGVAILLNSNNEEGFSSVEVEACTGIDLIGVFTGYRILKDYEYQTLIELVKLAVGPLEGKSPYLAGHIDRVVKISKKLAEKLGLSEEEQKDLEIAATIHDIGKTKLNECVLLKPIYAGAKLTNEEEKELKSHAEEGVKLLSSIPGVNKRVKEAVLYHHEYIDGSGFPSCLTGNEIPILAQIIGTVDAFDQALCKFRYHYPIDYLKKALDELEDSKGKLDPNIVDNLLIVLNEDKDVEKLLHNDTDKILKDAFIDADNGRRVEAHNKCDIAIKENKDNPAVYIAAGELMEHKNIEDYEIAIRYYSNVLEICPTFIEAYYRRGRAYEKFGQLRKAGIDYALAIKLCPTYIEAHLRLGQIRLQLINLNTQNYYFAALDSFNEVLQMEKDNVLAYLGKGKAFQALAEYFEKLANKPDIPADEAENNRKEAFKYFDNAITDCNTALQLLNFDRKRAKELNNNKDPEFEIRLYLGLSYSARKKWKEAHQCLSDASNSEDSFIKESAQYKLNSLKEMGVI